MTDDWLYRMVRTRGHLVVIACSAVHYIQAMALHTGDGFVVRPGAMPLGQGLASLPVASSAGRPF